MASPVATAAVARGTSAVCATERVHGVCGRGRRGGRVVSLPCWRPAQGTPQGLRPACPSVGRVTGRRGLRVRNSVSEAPGVASTRNSPLQGRKSWVWNGMTVKYQAFGEDNGPDAPPVLLVHGFGASSDHFRQNGPVLAAEGYRCYSIDLLGYGFSDKPAPSDSATLFKGVVPANVTFPTPNRLYGFETWSQQMTDFINEVVWDERYGQADENGVVLVSNSIGGMVALQTAVSFPSTVKAMYLFNVSLRKLHINNQQPLIRPLVRNFQTFLREGGAGQLFFSSLAKARPVKNVLKEAYHDPDTVTDELVDLFLQPGLEPGAVDVFLDFISYSSGPMVEELLAVNTTPVTLGWGAKDPWEKVEWGRALTRFDCVTGIDVIEGAGHCPQDEDPRRANEAVLRFLQEHAPLA